MATTYVIIVAAGSGSRFGSEIPKQFLDLQGKPVVAHAVDAFRNALPDAEIRLVLSEEMIPLWNGLCAEHGFESPIIVPGGATRWESVKNALSSLSEAPASATVMIHDGARPLVGSDVILRAAAAARNTDGAIPAIPVTDSPPANGCRRSTFHPGRPHRFPRRADPAGILPMASQGSIHTSLSG